jgi:hypothetical protein
LARRELLSLIVIGLPLLASVAALDACSGFEEGTDVTPPARDAASDGSPSSDADGIDDASPASDAGDAATKPCRFDAPFGEPNVLAGVSTANDEGMARLSPDELSIYFDRYVAGGGGPKVHMATRPNRATPFGNAVVVTAIDSPVNDLHPSISDDGRSLYFTRFNTDGHHDVLVTHRASLTAQFDTPEAVLVTGANETYPFARAGRLWFTKQRTAELIGIFEAALDGGDVRAHPELSGDAGEDDYAAVVSADGLAIYFSSERAGGPMPVNSTENIWFATRTALTVPWSEPQLVPVINSGHRELVGWISPDNCRLYFASNRLASLDVYVAERTP